MTDSEKLQILINTIKATCVWLCQSQYPDNLENMRLCLEKSLLHIGVKPYDDYPDFKMTPPVKINLHDENIQRANEDFSYFMFLNEEESAALVAKKDEDYYSRGA